MPFNHSTDPKKKRQAQPLDMGATIGWTLTLASVLLVAFVVWGCYSALQAPVATVIATAPTPTPIPVEPTPAVYTQHQRQGATITAPTNVGKADPLQ
jgi:hypothetical protein